MKNTYLLMLLFVLGSVQAQNTFWEIEPSHAKIGFSIPHFGISETEGKFQQYSGKVWATAPDFTDAQISLSIEVSSIDTDNAQRDEHLRGADFFEVETYPTIEFKSKALRPKGDQQFDLIGDFTMHGITKEIILDAKYRGTVKDPWGNTKAGFLITGTLNRLDYGLRWNTILEAGGLAVGEIVSLECNIELIKRSYQKEEVESSLVIPHAAKKVWEQIHDFNNLASLVPEVVQSTSVKGQGKAASWVIQLKNGEQVKEKMLDYDPANMIFSYTMTQTPMPLQNYVAIQKVIPRDANSCEVVFTTHFEVLPENKDALVKTFQNFQNTFLSNIEKLIK